jgi:hypothetical protein
MSFWRPIVDRNEILVSLFDALVQLKIPSMLVGSYCSNFYGYAAAGASADIVVSARPHPLSELPTLLGTQFKWKPNCQPMHGVLMHQLSNFWMNLFDLSNDLHNQASFERRRSVQFIDGTLQFPTPEDVIVTKLRWSKGGNRQKDVDHVRNVLAIQMENLDFDYIRRWCDQHGTRELLDTLVTNVRAEL